MNYIVGTVEEFMSKLDKLKEKLAPFSQEIDQRSDQIPALLDNFKRRVLEPTARSAKTDEHDEVAQAINKSLENLKMIVEGWDEKIKIERNAEKFQRKHQQYLVVMIFGAVKAGKSTLGNFFAGQKFLDAPFDNPYKHIAPPSFEIENDEGRAEGNLYRDERGDSWFKEDVTDTTGAIQYFTLSGLRWFDSPGTGAVKRKGDTEGIEVAKLVDKYIPYADMCIFLMNSSEPLLRDDMAYMQSLNENEQESLIVVTKSDEQDEDEDDDGNLIQTLVPKSEETRKKQEDSACERLRETCPEIDATKFRAMSISTALAGAAIKENDEEKFRASNLDKIMKKLIEKIGDIDNGIGDNAVERKRNAQRKHFNKFIDDVIKSLKDFEPDLDAIPRAIEKYKSEMGRISERIVRNVLREVRVEVGYRVSDWEAQVNRGSNVSDSEISAAVENILHQKLNQEINNQMRNVIDGYQAQEMTTVRANLSVTALAKQTVEIERSYDEQYKVERPPKGFWENVNSFLGATYYEMKTRRRTERRTRSASRRTCQSPSPSAITRSRWARRSSRRKRNPMSRSSPELSTSACFPT